MLKVGIFGIIIFGCYFGTTHGINCIVNTDPTNTTLGEAANCIYCGYNHIYRNDVNDTECTDPVGKSYSCLTVAQIVYDGNTFKPAVSTCKTNTINCLNYDLYICQSDNCNAQCGPAPTVPTTLPPALTTTPATTLPPTTTPAIATTTVGNSNDVSATTLSIYGLFLSVFISELLH